MCLKSITALPNCFPSIGHYQATWKTQNTITSHYKTIGKEQNCAFYTAGLSAMTVSYHDGFDSVCSLPSQRLALDPRMSWGMNEKDQWALSLDRVPVLNKTMCLTIIRLLAGFPWAILTHICSRSSWSGLRKKFSFFFFKYLFLSTLQLHSLTLCSWKPTIMHYLKII